MKTFEESRFPERIVSSGGLADMVRCTDSLTDANLLPLGTIYHLVSPQAGYQFDHIYICALKDGYRYWKDITESHDISLDESGCIARGYLVEWDGVLARLNAVWTTPEDTEDDVWIRDVLVRKIGNYPTGLLDGEVLTISSTRNQYNTFANQYQSGVISPDMTDCNYFYRVFHVFTSGAITYTNMEDTSLAGYATIAEFARTMDDEARTLNKDTAFIWKPVAASTSGTWTYDTIAVNGSIVFSTQTGTYKSVEGSEYKATRLYNTVINTTAMVTVTSHYSDGTTAESGILFIDQWSYIQKLIENKLLATGIIGKAHPYSAGDDYHYNYALREEYVTGTAPTGTTNHCIWIQEITDTSAKFRAVWSSVDTNATDGNPEYVAELILEHWPKMAPESDIQKVATPTYIGPIIKTSASTHDSSANPTIADFTIE